MSEITGHETEFKGSYGSAASFDVGDSPEAAETLCSWLLTAPQAHPLWTQYLLCVVRLRDAPGFPPPHLQFPGATHELIVVALDPERGPYKAETMMSQFGSGNLPYLLPVNIVYQVEATDDEARLLAAYAAWGVTVGALWPETADAPERIRGEWASSLVKTLAHIRGEVHAS